MRRHAQASVAGSTRAKGLGLFSLLCLAVVGLVAFLGSGAPAAGAATACPNEAFRVGASAELPDCRAYEMVSPVDKDNNDIIVMAAPDETLARVDRSSASGDAFTFSAKKAFGGALAGALSNQYLSRRGSDGWSTEPIGPRQAGEQLPGVSFNAALEIPFRGFSEDLETAWLIPAFGPNPDPTAPGGFANLFRRDNATGTYEGQIRAVPPHVGANFFSQYPELQGLSADGRHALIRTADNLTPDAPDISTNFTQLYEAHRDGSGPAQLRLVSIFPNGTPAETATTAGTANMSENSGFGRYDNVTHAISEDGSRIYWTAAGLGPGRIFVRVDGSETLPVSEAAVPADSSAARFYAASADGSKAIFAFTEGANAGKLYEYDLQAEEATPIAGELVGVVGQSDDLSHVYFVSREALAPGATAGQLNLYLHKATAGSLAFVGGLSSADTGGNFVYTATDIRPFQHAGAASADGSALAFVSYSKELAESVGYDNTDQKTGQPDGEVYRYDAEAEELACVSCNPSGARPIGQEMIVGGTSYRFFQSPDAAAWLPVPDSELYQSRYLSDDGSRLYFNSYESLVLDDTNGFMDVYQWQAPGSGSCTESSGAFVVQSGGCLDLISTGESQRESEFRDATPDGSDVFFTTLSSLVPQDPGLIDVYDARAGGGYPIPPPQQAPCEGEACQGPSLDRSEPTPASATYAGAGNAKPSAKARCGARKVRRKGRCVAKKRKQAKKNQHKRAQQRANDDRRAH